MKNNKKEITNVFLIVQLILSIFAVVFLIISIFEPSYLWIIWVILICKWSYWCYKWKNIIYI